MIRNVVIHVSNEQPLLADLYGVPAAGDVGLLCTNVRMLDGKRPIFIDAIDSTFFFPYLHLRFLEIPAAEMRRHLASGGAAPGTSDGTPDADGAGRDLAMVVREVDEPAAAGEDLDLDVDLELDEDFLQRIRDI